MPTFLPAAAAACPHAGRPSPMRFVLLLAFLIATAPSPSGAELLSWDVDETRSTISLATPDADALVFGIPILVGLRDQTGPIGSPWAVGTTASLDGDFLADLEEGVSIELLADFQGIDVLAAGSARPDPASFDPNAVDASNPNGRYLGTGTAPAAFSARVVVPLFLNGVDAGFFSLRAIEFGLSSAGALPISAGGFPGDQVDIGFRRLLEDFDGVDTQSGLGQAVPDALGVEQLGLIVSNTATAASVTTPDPTGAPDVREILLPIDATITIPIAGFDRDFSVTGQLVATSVPEPTGLAPFASAIAGMAMLGRARRNA